MAEARGAELREMGVDDVRPLTHSSTSLKVNTHSHTHTVWSESTHIVKSHDCHMLNIM